MKEIIILTARLYHLIARQYRRKAQGDNLFPLVAILICSFIVLTLPGQQGCTRDKPVKIGFIGGLTGRVADLGISGRNGAMLAVEQRNSTGGINGRPVQLIAVDDRQEKETAVTAFSSLVGQGVVAVIGPMTSSMSTATVPLADRSRTLMISPTSTTTYLSDLDDYFFRVSATTDTYSSQMAEYFRTARKADRATLVYDLGNREYTENWINHFSKEFQRLGGEIVQEVTYRSSQDIHFSDVARLVLTEETDVVIISSSAVDAAMISQQLRKLDHSVMIGMSEWAATEILLELGGKAVENVVVCQLFDRFSTSPRYIAFRTEYRARFGDDPGFPSVVGYDAAIVILDALERKEKRQGIKETVLAIGTFEGLQGPITFNRTGDSDRKAYLSVIRNGKFLGVGDGLQPSPSGTVNTD